MTTRRLVRATVGAAALAAVAAGCGGSSGGGTQTVSPAAATSGIAITTHDSPLGTYLTDGKGRSLYIFSADGMNSSSCSGACLHEWPPVTTTGAPRGTGQADGSMLGTTDSGTAKQVTYDGQPLYYYADDSSAGDMKGEGAKDFGGTWTVVSPSGSAIAPASPTSTPTGSSSDSSGSGDAWG